MNNHIQEALERIMDKFHHEVVYGNPSFYPDPFESFLQSELELLEKKVKGEGLSLKQGQRVTCETGCNFNDVGGCVCQRHQSLTTQKES